jgi:ATP-dependent exoDNAse (exonuclease V) alpha subunit
MHVTDNRRQRDGWERDALAGLRTGNIDTALDAYIAHGRIHQAPDSETLRAELISDYLHARAEAENPYDVAILAVSRADVAHLNALVRAALIAQGELGATPLHIRADVTANLAADDSFEMRTGDLVLIGRNDNRIDLCNGTRAVVTTVDVEADSLTLRTDDERDVTVSAVWAARHDLSHAYAMTLHKAQGLTVDHALLYGSDALTREAGYVGLSRGRRENHIYLSPTTRMAGRAGECDFDQPDPLADEQQPIAALARRLRTSRSHQLSSHQRPKTGEVHDRSTNTPAPDRKG